MGLDSNNLTTSNKKASSGGGVKIENNVKKLNRKAELKFTDLKFRTATSEEINKSKVSGYEYAF